MIASSPPSAKALPRLKKRREFLRVARKGRKWAAPGLVLQACAAASPAPDAGRSASGQSADKTALAPMARIGYTVTRKVGNAVIRNRVKRRLRAAAGRVMPAHARAGTDFVLIGRVATLTRPFERLVGDLETALRKLDCYRD